MSKVNKENEEKKKQGRKSEEGIIQIIFWNNIGGNKTAFSNRQLYSSFRLPVTFLEGFYDFDQFIDAFMQRFDYQMKIALEVDVNMEFTPSSRIS